MIKADGPARRNTSLKSEAASSLFTIVRLRDGAVNRAVRFGKPPSPAGRQVAAIDGSTRRGDYSGTKSAVVLIPGLQESMTAACEILALLVNPRYPSDPETQGGGPRLAGGSLSEQ